MGVLPCNRTGCNNIMCAYIILKGDDSKYICDDCLTELRAAQYSLNHVTTESEIKTFIMTFMESSIDSHIKLTSSGSFEQVLNCRSRYVEVDE